MQRFLRKLKNNGFFTDSDYDKIYPKGSSPARIYGLPKLHKVFSNSPVSSLPFRPIVSSIGTYNYKLAKHLGSLLSPYIPQDYCCADTFTFVKEIREVRLSDSFLVSYDVTSLFTNIPLDETIDIATNLIIENNPNFSFMLLLEHIFI